MTRENKLALIVGFSIILVVGVLVSDHFSQARQAQLTQVDDTPRTAPGDLIDPLAREDEPPARAETYSLPVASGQGLLGDAIRTTPGDEPSLALSDPDPLRGTGDPIDAGGPVVFHQGAPAESVAINDDPLQELLNNARERGVPLLTSPSPAMPRSFSVGDEPRPGGERPRPAATAPQTAEYVVQSGDSLYRIAERFMGSGEKWKELRDLNKDRLPNGEVIRIGMRLLVPASARPQAAAPARDTRPTTRPTGAAREYTVKSGDVLSVIAQRELGSSKRMGEILELNSDSLDDADEIYVGMTLRLPAR